MSERQRILLLEDDKNLGLVVQEHLQMNGFDVKLCADGAEGIEAYHADEFDLCLVDVMMPRMDGFSFAREVRQRDQETPIVFLTAKSFREDRIEGFKIGCDDYITKPFSVEELMLRIRAVLRRSGGKSEGKRELTEFKIGGYHFDSNRRLLTYDQQEWRLTQRESDLLRLFCQHMNQTLERKVALRQIWGDDSYFTGRSMDVFVSRLRKYLKEDDRVEIMGVHGKGFRLVVN